MNQLSLPWGNAVVVESDGPTPARPPSVSTPPCNASAERCRSAATALEKHIQAKHSSANGMLAQPPTRKRLQQADSQRREAIRLERIQSTLRKLADLHQAGSIGSDLVALTSRAAVERALFVQPPTGPIHAIYASTNGPESRAVMAIRLAREAMLKGIPGFFPTPPEIAEALVRFAKFGGQMATVLDHRRESGISLMSSENITPIHRSSIAN